MEVAYEDLDMDNSSEQLFVFHESVSTLQEIASDRVALQLWLHYITTSAKPKEIIEETNDFYGTALNLIYDYESEFAKLLKIPQRIEKMLKKSLMKIHTETKRVKCHFNGNYFFTNGISRYCVKNVDPNHIVWRPNGEIDYKKSASKILAEGKLNAEQKFVLMCMYGMATELEKFPTDSLSEFFWLLGITDLKIAYWISYHTPRHDLREIWLKMPGVIRPEDTSINVIMAMESVESSFLPYAFEYFWNRLSEVEQLTVALRVLSGSRSKSRLLQKIILSTMSSSQQLLLVDQIPFELMRNFTGTFFSSTEHGMPEKVFKVWTLVKRRITEQQFVEFLEDVLVNCNMMHSEKYMNMLNNVWDTASDRLKRHIVENPPSHIFLHLMQCEPYQPSMYRLLMKFLRLMNEDVRKDLIWQLTMVYSDILARRRDTNILNLCLPKESDQLQLKNCIMEPGGIMMDYCERKLDCLEFDEVINAVAFFSRNPRHSRKFFKTLLESGRLSAFTFILDYEKWNKLSNFIDTVFSNYSSTISRLKKQLVSSFSVREVDCWDKKENFSVLVKITEQVFSTEEMKTFKQTLLTSFQKMILSQTSWRDFEGKCYNTFFSWCSEDESRIVDLKDIVSIDAFFNDTFRTICSSPNDDPKHLLNRLNAFLKYVCVSNEEVELVKIRKYFERDWYWNRQVEQIFHDESTRHTISNWFFSVED